MNSGPIQLPVEFINRCTNNFADALKLGQGTFGAVYKGMADNRYFALKCLRFNFFWKIRRKKLVRLFKKNWR